MKIVTNAISTDNSKGRILGAVDFRVVPQMSARMQTENKTTMHRKPKATLAMVTLAILFGFMATMESAAFPCHAAKSNTKPVVVESVFCDSEYGTKMETAILEGNLKQVNELLSRYDHAIDDVIVVGCNRVELSNKDVTYDNDAQASRRVDEMRSRMGQMGIYNGQVMLGLDSGDLDRMGFNSSIGISVQGNYYSLVATGNYKVLGTPLMIAVRARRKQIVNKLLEMGANPNVFIAVANYDRADIISWNSSPYTYNSKITGGPWGCKRSKTYLCALLDCYMKMDLQIGRRQPNASDEDEIAKMLIEYGAGFIEEVDDYGRNMLWDVARVGSSYLLGEMVKSGFDVSHEDNQGNTILDYCSGSGSLSTSKFLRKLQELGAKQKCDSNNGNDGEGSSSPVRLASGKDQSAVTGRICSNGGYACPQPTPFDFRYSQKPDNSGEISMLQNQIWQLRLELEDARSNTRVATMQGIGWVTASMREQTIMQEISDCERHIMQLR